MSAAVAAPSPKTAEKEVKQTPEPLVEEDDEFEEFEAEAWDQRDEAVEEETLWADNWDDDDVDVKFLNQLRAEVNRNLKK